eukprot:1183479-Prorocentrum_minimum.AAC.2
MDALGGVNQVVNRPPPEPLRVPWCNKRATMHASPAPPDPLQTLSRPPSDPLQTPSRPPQRALV